MIVARIFMVCVLLTGFPTKSMNGTGQETYTLPEFKTVPQTIEEQILAVLIDSGFSVREQGIILAQSKHESGFYTNSISRKNNNVFSLHKRRNSIYTLPEKVLAEGCTCFASYRSIQDATLDYLQYRDRIRVPADLSVEEYVAFIKRKKYFTDNEECYLYSMKWLIKKSNAMVITFNIRYPGCPRGPYSSTEITSVLSSLFTSVNRSKEVCAMEVPD